MTELTQTQRRLLEAAARRKDHALLPPPAGLRLAGSALEASLTSLARRGLISGTLDNPAGYRLTPEGLAVTQAGGSTPTSGGDGTKARSDPAETELVSGRAPTNASPGAPSLKGKLAEIADLLAKPDGADLATLMAATGWQAHSVRAALTSLRKRGIGVTRESEAGGASRYRIGSEV